MSKIGNLIRVERERAGLDIRSLADRVRMGAWEIDVIEQGHRPPPQFPSPDQVLRIANEFPESVDTAAWLWALLRDLWGDPIADLMQKHAVVVAAEPLDRTGRTSEAEG